MKILSIGVELFYADGQTDMTKLTAAFRKFYESAVKRISELLSP